MSATRVPQAADEPRQTPQLRENLRRSNVTAEVARTDRQAVWQKSFRPKVRRWIAAYAGVGQRDLYLWQWCLHGVELTSLSCVAPVWREQLCDTKLLSVILCVLFDDVADCGERSEWLSAMLLACGQPGIGAAGELSEFENSHVQLTRELWEEYRERVSQLPQYEEFEPVWTFDLNQFFNAMRYGHLANRYPALLNSTEHDVYAPHNMLMVSFSTLDLMASPPLPEAELGHLREALWHAQAMGRVGNVLSTWRREIRDRDFTGGIFSRALKNGHLTIDDLKSMPGKDLEERIRNSGLEAELLKKWERHRRCFQEAAAHVAHVDMEQVLDGHERFLELHLGSVGLI